MGLPRSWNSWVSPWTLLASWPVSLRISLTKHPLSGFATCGTSSLLGLFSLPVMSFPRVRTDLYVRQLLLDHWNGISLFLSPYTETSPDIHHIEWFQCKWLSCHQLSSLTGVSITWQQLYPMYHVCTIWAPLWVNKRICLYCDNQAVIAFFQELQK